jgi:hypothetical protein
LRQFRQAAGETNPDSRGGLMALKNAYPDKLLRKPDGNNDKLKQVLLDNATRASRPTARPSSF